MADDKNETSETKQGQENQDASGTGEDQQESKELDPVLAEKTKKYVEKLLAEKLLLDNAKHPNAIKLLKQEIEEIQATGARANKSTMYLNVFKYKPVKVVVKVLVPIKQYPGFNFVGKILGPKGQNFKNLQEDTMCRMAIFGKGSMKDKKKEEELRNSLDPKYSHLTEDLHVEISAMAPPAEAYARVAYALTEIQKYLIPNDDELMMLQDNPEYRNAMNSSGGGPPRKPFRQGGPPKGGPQGRGGGPPQRPGGGPMRPGPNRLPQPPRLMPAKAKVMSILDRARNAMDDYSGGPGGSGGYDDFGGPNSGYGGNYGGGYDDYEGDYYGGDSYGEVANLCLGGLDFDIPFDGETPNQKPPSPVENNFHGVEAPLTNYAAPPSPQIVERGISHKDEKIQPPLLESCDYMMVMYTVLTLKILYYKYFS